MKIKNFLKLNNYLFAIEIKFKVKASVVYKLQVKSPIKIDDTYCEHNEENYLKFYSESGSIRPNFITIVEIARC